MTRHRKRTPLTVGAVADRSNTNPLCPDCDYRTSSISACEVACRRCGQVFTVTGRAARLLGAVFGAVPTDSEDDGAVWI